MAPEQPTVDPTPASRVYRREQIVYFIFGIIEVLIIIRIVLRLLAANPDAAFTSLIYTLTAPFIAPFEGVFPTPQRNGSVLELSSVLAVIVYALLAYLIARAIEVFTRRRNNGYYTNGRTTTTTTVDSTDTTAPPPPPPPVYRDNVPPGPYQ
ncbi:MAG TPA: YggT family protein [Ktedonobacterales bacterium]